MSREPQISMIMENEQTPLIMRLSPETMGLSKAKRAIIFGVSWFAIVIGVVVGIFWMPIYDAIVAHELVLSPTSRSYSMWQETPIPMYLKIYLFNWTNPDDLNKTNSKPHFNQLGPYVFREVDYKVNQVWNSNGTITFQQNRLWHFDASQSNGSLDDEITNLNPIAVTLAYKVRHKGFLSRIGVNALLKILNETRVITKTAGELLFDGYDDELLVIASKLNSSEMIPYKKFGWFYGRNNSETYDGTFNILTGSKQKDFRGVLQEWNYSNRSKYYRGQCGAINGTLGDLWPRLTHNNTVPIFAPDVCTLVHLDYENTVDFDGLMGKKYISTANMLDNGTNVPSRACYREDGESLPTGLLNVSSCKFSAPAFISLPHFYLADDSYIEAVDGLSPEKEKHEFSAVVHPELGIPLQIKARLQLNLEIQHVDRIKLFDKLNKTYIPILWFSQEANLTSSYVKQIKFILILPLLGHVTFYGIAGLGVLVFFVGIGILIRAQRKAEDSRRLIARTENISNSMG